MLNPREQLSLAIQIASTAHLMDYDMGGRPYILHPLRCMMRLRTDDHLRMAIMVMHDVLEDHGGDICPLDTSSLKRTYSEVIQDHFSQRVIDGLDHLTKRDGEEYEAFIERCCSNYDSVLCKIEDVDDNSRITRLKGVRDKDFDRLKKYNLAYLRLVKAKKEFEEMLNGGYTN